jgi:hypothetical protein
MTPTVEQLVDALKAISSQQPTLSGCRSADENVWTNETDGNGRRVLRLSADHVTTICRALGVSHAVARGVDAWSTTSPSQTAWAGIIDVALTARGAAPGEMRSEAFAALTRVDVATLERMASLVLGDRAGGGAEAAERLAALEAAAARRSGCSNCRPCPCTEVD